MTENSEPLLTPLQREYLARNPEASVVEQPAGLAAGHISGVGGWLGLLTASLLVIGPVLNAVRTQSELEISQASQTQTHLSQVNMIAVWAYFSLYATLSIFAGYRLAKHFKPSTIPIVIVCIWLPIIIDIALAFFSREGDVSVVRSVLWASIWTAYLLRSKRVRNTYYPSGA